MSKSTVAHREPQPPSPRSAKTDDDFLASHLSGLLARQPSLTQAKGQQSSSYSTATQQTNRSAGPSRQSSIRASGSIGSHNVFAQEDVFSSFLRHKPSDGQDVHKDALRSSASSGKAHEIKRNSATSEPAPNMDTFGRTRRGPSSVSMSISFGGRRSKSSRSGTDGPSDDGSIASQSSVLSDYHSAGPLTSPPISSSSLRDFMPGKLGDAKSRQYTSNETMITIPSTGGMDDGASTGKSGAMEWNPAFLHYRRPSKSPSNATSSLGGNSPPSSNCDGSSISTSNQLTQSRKEDEQQRMFDDGSSIEPPDVTDETPDLARRIRDRQMSRPHPASSYTANAKHSSMMTRRPSPKRSSLIKVRKALTDANSSYGGLDSYDGRSQTCSQTNTGSTPRGLGSEAGSILTSSLGSITARQAKEASISDAAATSIILPNSNSDAVEPTTLSTAARKQSVTLIPASEDGRTFKFVTATQ